MRFDDRVLIKAGFRNIDCKVLAPVPQVSGQAPGRAEE
jgi:hypothetical protein